MAHRTYMRLLRTLRGWEIWMTTRMLYTLCSQWIIREKNKQQTNFITTFKRPHYDVARIGRKHNPIWLIEWFGNFFFIQQLYHANYAEGDRKRKKNQTMCFAKTMCILAVNVLKNLQSTRNPCKLVFYTRIALQWQCNWQTFKNCCIYIYILFFLF